MKKGLKGFLTIVEYLLLAFIVYTLLVLLLPMDRLYDDPAAIKEAKQNGTYYRSRQPEQMYFGQKLSSKGLIYDGQKNEAVILLAGRDFIPSNPNLTVKTAAGKTAVFSKGGGSSSGLFQTTGYYHYENLPKNIERITLSSDRYGESFSFTYVVRGGENIE